MQERVSKFVTDKSNVPRYQRRMRKERLHPVHTGAWPNRIREWRRKLGLSGPQLAEMAGTTKQNVSRYETGFCDIPLYQLRVLGAALGLPMADLLNTEDGGLTERERQIIEIMRAVPEHQRTQLHDSIVSLVQPFLPQTPAKPDPNPRQMPGRE